MSEQTNLFHNTEPTLCGLLEKIVLDIKKTFLNPSETSDFDKGFEAASNLILTEIDKLKIPEIALLKKAYCEGGIYIESANEWAKKFETNTND